MLALKQKEYNDNTMIVSKEQLDCFDAQGKPSKKLVISYVNKDKGISFFQWNVP